VILAAIRMAKPVIVGSQSLAHFEDPLEGRKADLYVLPYPTPLPGPLAHQQDSYLGQLFLQQLPSVGEFPEDFARQTFAQVRLDQELLGHSDLRHVGGVSS
jgi:hypothetical protein